jgi:hypothetical protein
MAKKFYKIDSRGPYYKTFYNRILRIFIITRVFVPGKPFQPRLVFVGKTGAFPSEALFRCYTLGLGSWPHPQTLD